MEISVPSIAKCEVRNITGAHITAPVPRNEETQETTGIGNLTGAVGAGLGMARGMFHNPNTNRANIFGQHNMDWFVCFFFYFCFSFFFFF